MVKRSSGLRILWVDAVDHRFEVERRYQPLGIFYMTAQLKRRFASQDIEFRLINKNILRELKRFSPDVVAISCVSQNYNLAKTYAQWAKNCGSVVVVGGAHISAIPRSLTQDMDAGVLGEGEITFGDLVELFLNQGQLSPVQLEHIPGLVYWSERQMQVSTVRQPIGDLDSIAHPEREMMNRITQLNILSSRGCPFRCAFCFCRSNWGNIRFFSPEYVCEEIRRIIAAAGENKTLSFWDDLFTARYSRLELLYKLLDENGLLGKFRFTCSARSNTLKEDTVLLLKEMGCVSVGMGLESGNPDILRYLKGDGISLDDHTRAIERLKRHGVEVGASFIIGSPQETWEQIMDTYNFIKSSQIDIFDIYLLVPLPGTPIWDSAKERDLVDDDMDWSRLNFRFADAPDRVIVVSEHLNRKQLMQLYEKLKKLRWKRLLQTLWGSPLLWKLPGIAWGMLRERVVQLLSASGSVS